MIIDVHTHIWSDQSDADVDDFVRAMDEHGIDLAAVLPIHPYVTNEEVADRVRRHPDRLVGFASVPPFSETTGIPRTDPVEQLRSAVRDLGLRGLKLHPTMQGFSLDNPGLIPLMNEAADLGIPVLFHTGPTRGRAGRLKHALIEHIDDLAIMCPRTVIVAGHGDILNYGPFIAAKHPNVYLETSIVWPRLSQIMPNIGAYAVQEASSEKILFGTDANPHKLQRFTDTKRSLDDANISDADRANIMGENARKILGLSAS